MKSEPIGLTTNERTTTTIAAATFQDWITSNYNWQIHNIQFKNKIIVRVARWKLICTFVKQRFSASFFGLIFHFVSFTHSTPLALKTRGPLFIENGKFVRFSKSSAFTICTHAVFPMPDDLWMCRHFDGRIARHALCSFQLISKSYMRRPGNKSLKIYRNVKFWIRNGKLLVKIWNVNTLN